MNRRTTPAALYGHDDPSAAKPQPNASRRAITTWRFAPDVPAARVRGGVNRL